MSSSDIFSDSDSYELNIDQYHRIPDNDNISDTECGRRQIIVGICAMEKKVISKPMEEVLSRLEKFSYLRIIVFPEPAILNLPHGRWPRCDCFICFHSGGFPLDKARQYVYARRPFVINDIGMQYKLLDRITTYRILDEGGIPHPKFILVKKGDEVADTGDQIEKDGLVVSKPFVEKPTDSEDHNIYIYFPSAVGGGCQRLFRKIGCRSSVYSTVSQVRADRDYMYEEFMPTDGIDVKVYTVGPEYAHAEARKSPGLDGKVERDKYGKEVRYPIILRAEEKLIARKICLDFKQTVCGFDLLRANGKSYVCDVNGFSFVKNSTKYYDDCALILGNNIMRTLAPQFAIPYSIMFRPEAVPYVATTYGTKMELRCVIAVIRHGDRTPKQKMKMEVSHELFLVFFDKCNVKNKSEIKLKNPSDLQAVLDITRKLLEINGLQREDKSALFIDEQTQKLQQLKVVLEMYGHFSGINRKVQMKKMSTGGNENTQYLLLILKWGGELTEVGRNKAMALGKAFRKMYPGGQEAYTGIAQDGPDTGLLRLHSTYRHDLKIYASDEGRVQMTAAAFTKGFLALEGELAPILVQMVKSANTNGLLDDDMDANRLRSTIKKKLSKFLSVDHVLDDEDIRQVVPTNQEPIVDRLKEVGNPLAACRMVAEYIKEMTNLIKMKMMDSNLYKSKLYHSESWELMLRRWVKLERDFYNEETQTFDYSKISVIYDCIKYDYVHNQQILRFDNARDLYTLSKLLSEIYVPQEYGITKGEKLAIARGIINPLLNKIRSDLRRNVDWSPPEGDETEGSLQEEEDDSRLDPRRLTEDERCTLGIETPGRHVRTRLYFTSESHVHSLVNVLKYGDLFQSPNSQWTAALEHLGTIAELGYLTQIIMMLYEDPNVLRDSENRFHVEIRFSPGFPEDVVPESATLDETLVQLSSARPIPLRTTRVDRIGGASVPVEEQYQYSLRRAGSHENVRSQHRDYVETENVVNGSRGRRHSSRARDSSADKSRAVSNGSQHKYDRAASYQTYHGMSAEMRTTLESMFPTVKVGNDTRFNLAAMLPPVEDSESPWSQHETNTLHNSLSIKSLNVFLDRMLESKCGSSLEDIWNTVNEDALEQLLTRYGPGQLVNECRKSESHSNVEDDGHDDSCHGGNDGHNDSCHGGNDQNNERSNEAVLKSGVGWSKLQCGEW